MRAERQADHRTRVDPVYKNEGKETPKPVVTDESWPPGELIGPNVNLVDIAWV